MKSAVAFLAVSAVLAVVSASGGYGGGASSGGYGASIPAPPCPKNYLFSCQPNLSPAPCAPPASGGYGGAGAYSENIPTIVNAPYPGYQGGGYPLNLQQYPNFYGHGVSTN